MPDFIDLVPFIDRTRWLMFQACAAPGVEAKKFFTDMKMSERQVHEILLSEHGDIRDLNLRDIAHWFYFSTGKTPEFTMRRHTDWSSHRRPR